MNVCLVQMNILWGDVPGNLERLDRSLRDAPAADLYVLPEMFTTGFATPADARVEEEPSAGLEWMKSFSASRNAAVCGSVALKPTGAGKCVNRMYFVTPEGEPCFYDKRHLFTFGGEDERFSAGRRRVVAEYRGVRFLLSVCYDLRFPVWLRGRGDYDALIVAASWPAARRDAWDALVKARAIENQCYVLAVNRVGKDPACTYDGGTAALDFLGSGISSVPDGEEGFCMAELDMRKLRAFRRDFPALEDADRFELEP